jgi:hypothetical protein
MAKHHIIITGTGRAGTTFLVQLFTALKLDTGFTGTTSAVCPDCNAGMECDILEPDAPYIIKSPWLCDRLDNLLQDRNIIIDHVIIPVRELYAAAESRRNVTSRVSQGVYGEFIQGGVWDVESPDQQEPVLATKLYQLIYAVAKHDLPVTLLYFPQFVYDAAYLYRKLPFLFNEIDFECFREVYSQVVQPELIHDFTKPGDEASIIV